MPGDTNKKIHFFSQSLNISLKDRKKFKSFVDYILKNEGKSLNLINFIFCTDEELRKLNNDFLKHDYYTDILTFDLSENKKDVTADIFISIDRTRDNAKSFSVSFSQELHRVMIHGVLHLCGYKDKKSSDIKKIRAKENWYLLKYFK
jgi:probable rRNA maturation factor